MSWANIFDSYFGTIAWLMYSAISGFLLLSIGAIAVRCCRQPIYRIRIIQWTFAACLIVPAVQYLGIMPFYKVAIAAPQRTEQPNLTTPISQPIGDRIDAYDAAVSKNGRYPGNALNDESSESTSSEVTIDKTVGSQTSTSEIPSRNYGLVLALLVQSIYFAGLAIFATRWATGWLIRLRLQRGCQNASKHIAEALENIAGRNAKSVRLLHSDRLLSSVMWGVVRPTIVLPTAIACSEDESQLKWSLAHEWSHVQRFDFLALQLAVVTKFVCFFQPLYWWLKRELSLCQDIIADAFAASFGESEDYASFLVQTSQRQNCSVASVGLGIAERQSNLFKRVGQLVQPNRQLQMSTSKLLTGAMAVAAISLIATLGSIQIIGRQAVADEAKASVNKTDADSRSDQAKNSKEELKHTKPTALARNLPPAPGVEPTTYHGKVVDSVTGKPVYDAVVEVSRQLSRDPNTNEWSLIETTEHRSNENGEYQFTLPSEQVAQKSLILNVRVRHATYQPTGRWSGDAHSTILKNLEKGDEPFYTTIKLDAGAPITGVIASPDGVPLEGVQVRCYSSRPISKKERKEAFHHIQMSLQSTQTDRDGRFRFNVATPGDGVLWFYPKDFAAEAYRLRDRRGDLGTFKLSDGVRVTGRILDEKGIGIANVGIEYQMYGSGPDADEFLRDNYSEDIIGGTTTRDDGTFTLVPLGPGKYRIKVSDSVLDTSTPEGNYMGDWRTHLLENRLPLMPYVFDNRIIEVVTGKPVEPLEFQALPQISVRGSFVDSQGNPRAGAMQGLFGQFNGDGFINERQSKNDGSFQLRAPLGVENAVVSVGVGALRWKLAGMKDLNYGEEIPLGKLDRDVEGIEVVRYVAPVLLIKAIDEDGHPISDFKLTSQYSAEPTPVNGVIPKTRICPTGSVWFESQSDGRSRSSQLLPDQEIKIDVIKEGFDVRPQSVSLKEGETRELTFIFKKKSTNDLEQPE